MVNDKNLLKNEKQNLKDCSKTIIFAGDFFQKW